MYRSAPSFAWRKISHQPRLGHLLPEVINCQPPAVIIFDEDGDVSTYQRCGQVGEVTVKCWMTLSNAKLYPGEVRIAYVHYHLIQ